MTWDIIVFFPISLFFDIPRCLAAYAFYFLFLPPYFRVIAMLLCLFLIFFSSFRLLILLHYEIYTLVFIYHAFLPPWRRQLLVFFDTPHLFSAPPLFIFINIWAIIDIIFHYFRRHDTIIYFHFLHFPFLQFSLFIT